MKKIFALLMLFSLCLVTTGCPKADDKKATPSPAPTTPDKGGPPTTPAPTPPVTPDKAK
jgi:hypothetical protein